MTEGTNTKTTNLFVGWVVLDKFDVRAILKFRAAGFDVEIGEDMPGIEYVNIYVRIVTEIDEGWGEGDGPWNLKDYPIRQALEQRIDSIGGEGCCVAEATFRNPTPADWRYRPEI
jgi:hypothetical protein